MAVASNLVSAKPEHPRGLPTAALARLLDDLVAVLMEIPQEVYVARPVPDVSGSIGEHVRHTLDHVAAFLALRSSTTLSYDRRERGTAAETDPSAALRQIFRLKTALSQRSDGGTDEPVFVTSVVSASGQSVAGWSTAARELGFVVSHTIHHHALIALLLAFQGLRVPSRFGYAPSTPQA